MQRTCCNCAYSAVLLHRTCANPATQQTRPNLVHLIMGNDNDSHGIMLDVLNNRTEPINNCSARVRLHKMLDWAHT